MTALYIDGFEDGAFAQRYTVSGTAPTLITGRLGVDTALNLGTANIKLQRAIPASAQIFIGFAFQASAFSSSSMQFLGLHGDNGATEHLQFLRTGTGAITIQRGGVLLASSAAGVLGLSQWGYIEVNATISDTVGVATVRLNGTQIVTFTGDTKNGGTATNFDAFSLLDASAGNAAIFDDLYVFNALGTINNTWAGDSRVQTLAPSGPGNSTQLTPAGSANNWQNVDEAPFSTADYNASATVGQKDTYAMANLLTSTTTVKCVQESMIAHKSDAGAGSMKTVIRSGGTDYPDTAAALGTTPSWSGTLRETDPATSAAWTVAGVNAAEVGAEVT